MPVPGCNCLFINVSISQDDLDNAINNTGFTNNTVYLDYTDCDGNPTTQTYSVAGFYTNSVCADETQPINIFYYNTDIPQDGLSDYDPTYTQCCPTPTPTPTQTLTPTTTLTPTPTPTNTTTLTSTPTPTPTATDCYDVIDFDGGGQQGFAILNNGKTFGWGNNSTGQLGNDSTVNECTPVAVCGGITFVKISSGSGHSLGLTNSGVLYSWGSNTNGQLGINSTTNQSTPVAVCGSHTFCHISVGQVHSLAIDNNGMAWAWGNNIGGRLGDNTTTSRLTPVAVCASTTFVQISAGSNFSVGLDTNGIAYAWGSNGSGQLGDGSITNRSTPVAVCGGLIFSQISAGALTTLALTTTSVAYGWGRNTVGQIGDGTITDRCQPVSVIGGYTFTKISAGLNASGYGITSSGVGYAWGDNTYGQLGNNSTTNVSSPVAICGGYAFSDIRAGIDCAFGLTTNARLYSWGGNSAGQLGIGTLVDELQPQPVLIEYCEVPPTPTPTLTPTLTLTQTLTPTPSDTPVPVDCTNSSFDVCILIDESSSVKPSGFTYLTQAIVNLVNNIQGQISYSFPGYQFGLVSFAITVDNILPLSSDYQTIIDAITGNTYGNEPGTFLNLGLQGAYENLTGSTNTRNVDKKIIIYTDGAPSNTALAKAKAEEIKSAYYNSQYRTEIMVVAINTTTYTFNWLANNIASSPAQAFSAESFTTLSELTDQILGELCNEMLTPTPTPTETLTPTPTVTPTQTATPTISATQPISYQFQNCDDGSQIFRFAGIIPDLPLGNVYYISGGDDFVGCATVVENTGEGILYSALGVTFMEVPSCANDICPRTPRQSALLIHCSDRTVFYATVDQDTAFVGAVYVYNGECYEFVEFSGPGGEYLGSPDYDDCSFCNPIPTVTVQPTPTLTPTPSTTPSPCGSNEFCFNTILPSLSGYSGNYTYVGTYNGYPYYQNGSVGYIYHTGDYWCLSDTLGGSCVLEGSYPCESICPDISANYFTTGNCPTPTPLPVDCNIFDFNAYFDCDWEPVPTSTLPIDCDDVDFVFYSTPATPTPTPSGEFCSNVGVEFNLIVIGPTPTPTPTPTATSGEVVNIGGDVTFVMMEEQFNCVSVKVLIDCATGEELYTNDNITWSGSPIVQGVTFLALINGENKCLFYSRDDLNISSNSNVEEVYGLYSNCDTCRTPDTPTPTPSQTPTLTPTSTPTPTPSLTSNMVFVYESCSPVGDNPFPKLTQVIQNLPAGLNIVPEEVFKDINSNCWRYVGLFENSYVAPPNVYVLTINGNYFINTQPTIYPSCEVCQQITI